MLFQNDRIIFNCYPKFMRIFRRGLFSLDSLFSVCCIIILKYSSIVLKWFAFNFLFLHFIFFFCFSGWFLYSVFLLIIDCFGYYSRRNEKISYPYERKQLLYYDLFSFLASETAVKRDMCDLRSQKYPLKPQ